VEEKQWIKREIEIKIKNNNKSNGDDDDAVVARRSGKRAAGGVSDGAPWRPCRLTPA
jgi:hypothetical protein